MMSCITSSRMASSMCLVRSMRSSRYSYWADHSFPSFLYSKLILFSNFYYSPGSSSLLWNCPTLVKALEHIYFTILFSSPSNAFFSIFLFLCLLGSNFLSQGSTTLYILVFQRIQERQLESNRLCILIRDYKKLLNFLSSSLILNFQAQYQSWYQQKRELGMIGMFIYSSSSVYYYYYYSSYQWWIFRKLRGLMRLNLLNTSDSQFCIIQLVSPVRYYSIVPSVTFRPGREFFFFFLRMLLLVKAWNSQQNSFKTKNIISSDKTFSSFKDLIYVFFYCYQIGPVPTPVSINQTASLAQKISIFGWVTGYYDCSSVQNLYYFSMSSTFSGLLM